MEILMHRYGRDGRYLETFYSHSDIDVKLEDLKAPKGCVFAEQHPLPKVDSEHIPVWDSEAKGWTVKAKAFYERPSYRHEWDEATETWVEIPPPVIEPALDDRAHLKKTLIALIDKVEKGTAIPEEITTLAEAEKAKLEYESTLESTK